MGAAKEDLHFEHKAAGKLNQIHADSMLEFSGADFCLCGSRTLRGHVSKGEVTYKDLHDALPFTEENIVTLKASGEKIIQEIESRLKDGARGIAVPAGLKYTYDPSLPNGKRVLSVTFPDGKPLETEKEYNVVMNGPMAQNERFVKSKDYKEIGNIQKVFMDYFKAGSPWGDDPDDRVKVDNSFFFLFKFYPANDHKIGPLNYSFCMAINNLIKIFRLLPSIFEAVVVIHS